MIIARILWTQSLSFATHPIEHYYWQFVYTVPCVRTEMINVRFWCGRQKLVISCVRVHRRTSLMTLFLFHQQCLPYLSFLSGLPDGRQMAIRQLFFRYCFQDLFKTTHSLLSRYHSNLYRFFLPYANKLSGFEPNLRSTNFVLKRSTWSFFILFHFLLIFSRQNNEGSDERVLLVNVDQSGTQHSPDLQKWTHFPRYNSASYPGPPFLKWDSNLM